jgi:hypothetical protein
MFHAALPFVMLVAAPRRPRSIISSKRSTSCIPPTMGLKPNTPSDSVLMILDAGVVLFSEGNQHHGEKLAFVVLDPGGIGR